MSDFAKTSFVLSLSDNNKLMLLLSNVSWFGHILLISECRKIFWLCLNYPNVSLLGCQKYDGCSSKTEKPVGKWCRFAILPSQKKVVDDEEEDKNTWKVQWHTFCFMIGTFNRDYICNQPFWRQLYCDEFSFLTLLNEDDCHYPIATFCHVSMARCNIFFPIMPFLRLCQHNKSLS